MSEGYVRSTIQDKIKTIEFFHPKSNSLPAQLLEALSGEIARSDDENCGVVILKSAGEKAFCAGASFSELLEINDEEQGFAFFSGFANVINAMRKCGKLIIGRVQGSCVGGGVGIAAAADYTLATKDARVKLSELAVGIGPFVVGPAIERKTGLSAFSQLAVNANAWQTAEWAHRKGLYADLFEETAQLDAAIEKLAAELAASNPEATRELKRMFWQGTENWDELLAERAKISGRLVLSDFTGKAIRGFKAK